MSAEGANGEGSSVIGAMAVDGELDGGSVMAAGGGQERCRWQRESRENAAEKYGDGSVMERD